ncbi:hypothetical protein ZIOFF_065761 [Zingiber officinale]|uniref:Nucleotide-diphospho-sugar transferase domain-containing protein n=1 Tax=Zingiber officinale TaxID=94328 RepID=A0A8J5K793_ZINOF|nr:hypothetical protein ZIOFF_065761 [Zingiber officinale]
MKSSAAFGVKAADSLNRRWLFQLLFFGIVALSLTLLFHGTFYPFPTSSLRVQLNGGPPVVAEQQSSDSDFSRSSFPTPVLQRQSSSSETAVVASDPPPETQEMRLERVLRAAATPDKTVLMTSLNAFWSTPGSVLDVFLESFRIGDGTTALLDHLVIVAVDDKAYERCLAVHRHCFDFKVPGVDFSSEKVFNTPEYLDMMWARLDFLRLVLEKGFNFVFSSEYMMSCPSKAFKSLGESIRAVTLSQSMYEIGSFSGSHAKARKRQGHEYTEKEKAIGNFPFPSGDSTLKSELSSPPDKLGLKF